MALFISLLTVGIVGGEILEGWSAITSFYVIVQIVTTIGYGDLTVTHGYTKVAMAIYALCAMVLGGYYLSLFTRAAHQESQQRIKLRLRYLCRSECTGLARYTSLLFRNPKLVDLAVAGIWVLAAVAFGTVFFRVFEHCSCSYGRTKVEACEERDFKHCKESGGYVKTWVDTFYMSVITVLSIGFGDHSPRSELGRLVGSIWMLIGVGCAANFVAAISNVLDAEKELELFGDPLETSRKRFAEMDIDGNGRLSRGEYLSFMLTHHNLVSEEVMDELNSMFVEICEDNSSCSSGSLEVTKQATLENLARFSEKAAQVARTETFSRSPSQEDAAKGNQAASRTQSRTGSSRGAATTFGEDAN